MSRKEAVCLRLPKLDERLQAACDLFPQCCLGADIGTDHGRLPLTLLAEDRCERMIVADISLPALSKAKELLTLHALDHRAAFIQADGLSALQAPVQAISLMGMGGDTMSDILLAAPSKLQGAALILSPHTEIHKVREVLPRIGYMITNEIIARSGGRFYVIIKALPGQAEYTEKDLLLGPCLVRERPLHYTEYLLWRQRVAQKALKALKHSDGTAPAAPQWFRLNDYIREELQCS